MLPGAVNLECECNLDESEVIRVLFRGDADRKEVGEVRG
jgi:hypothetical protein